MKKIELHQKDEQKLVRYFQKITQILLHLYTYINATPSVIEIHNIVDYTHNIHVMVQQFYKTFQKKFIPIQVFKKLQTELNQKNQKVNHLINSQKNLKIELKVMEDKLNEAQKKLQQTLYKKQFTLPQKIRKTILQKDNETSIQQKSKLDKPQTEVKKKRTSLPHLSTSSSTNLASRQKFINVLRKKKSLFVNIPGEGNEALIHHLMSKISIK